MTQKNCEICKTRKATHISSGYRKMKEGIYACADCAALTSCEFAPKKDKNKEILCVDSFFNTLENEVVQ